MLLISVNPATSAYQNKSKKKFSKYREIIIRPSLVNCFQVLLREQMLILTKTSLKDSRVRHWEKFGCQTLILALLETLQLVKQNLIAPSQLHILNFRVLGLHIGKI